MDNSKKKSYKKWLTYKGKLGGPGYLTRSKDDREKLLKSCVYRHGYRSCLGSLTAMKRNKNTQQKFNPELESNSVYLKKDFGGVGSYGPRNLYKKKCKLIKRSKSRRTRSRK